MAGYINNISDRCRCPRRTRRWKNHNKQTLLVRAICYRRFGTIEWFARPFGTKPRLLFQPEFSTFRHFVFRHFYWTVTLACSEKWDVKVCQRQFLIAYLENGKIANPWKALLVKILYEYDFLKIWVLSFVLNSVMSYIIFK